MSRKRAKLSVAQATLGPPAFFPVGNAAGRFEALQAARIGAAPAAVFREVSVGASTNRKGPMDFVQRGSSVPWLGKYREQANYL